MNWDKCTRHLCTPLLWRCAYVYMRLHTFPWLLGLDDLLFELTLTNLTEGEIASNNIIMQKSICFVDPTPKLAWEIPNQCNNTNWDEQIMNRWRACFTWTIFYYHGQRYFRVIYVYVLMHIHGHGWMYCSWGVEHTGEFRHHMSASPIVIEWKVVAQHLFLNIFLSNFTTGTGHKFWYDRSMSPHPHRQTHLRWERTQWCFNK
jgi:hypothetical protein